MFIAKVNVTKSADNKVQPMGVADTAFLVCESRARKVELSGDAYASKWIPPVRRKAVRELWDQYAGAVYPHDDLVLAIRNRYYLNIIEEFLRRNPAAAIFNLGAGLTSYPYLLDEDARWTEVDQPQLVSFKEARTRDLLDKSIIPVRSVEFISADLSRNLEIKEILDQLADVSKGRPSLVLMEGLSYYLDRQHLDALFHGLSRTQATNSVLVLDYWRSSDSGHPVLERQSEFFAKLLELDPKKYTFFDDQDLVIPGYDEVSRSDVCAKSSALNLGLVMPPAEVVLPEWSILYSKT